MKETKPKGANHPADRQEAGLSVAGEVEVGRLRAVAVLVALFVGLLPGRALATPVCTDGYMGGPDRDLCGGRVFPEADMTREYVQYSPDPTGFREYQHGIEYLAQLYPQWISVFTLRDRYQEPTAVSAGPDGRRADEAGDTGDGHDIFVIKITDHSIPDDGKETLLYSLSIHGDEKGGIEGGLRTAEDLAIAAENEGTIPNGVEGYESTTGSEPEIHEFKVADVLAKEVVYLVDFNIDGWRAGDNFSSSGFGGPGTPGLLYTRQNENTDLNRQMPTVGWINSSRNPLEEQEMLWGHKFMHEVAAAGVGGQMAYGADVHGEGQSRAWADIMYPAGQFDSVKHRRLMSIAERTKSVMDATLFQGGPNEIEELTGGDAGEGIEDFGAPRNTIPTKPARWGTVWDTLGYTDTGFLGDYMATELGVTGMDYEIALNHADTRPYGRPWGVLLQENYINATRAIIKTAMAYAMTEREDFADFQIEPGGRVGYLYNPTPVTDSDANGPGTLPGPNADGIGRNGKPVAQMPYSATNMNFFEDEDEYVVGGFNKALPAAISNDPTYLDQFDSLVIADVLLPEDAAGGSVDPTAFFQNLKAWVERGGNLVLTDRALHALEEMGVVADGSVQDITVYQPYSNFQDLDHPMVEGLRGNARQLSEATLIGYRIPSSQSSQTAYSPMSIVTRDAFLGAGGEIVGTTGNTPGTSDDGTRVSVGEIALGDGQIRIMGGGLAMPTEAYDHRYGLKDYSLTYSGLFILENSIVHDHPLLGELPEAAATTLTLNGAETGQYTDEVSLGAVLTDATGDPIENSLVTFELSNETFNESWTGTTGPDGSVSVPARLAVAPGTYLLTARYQGETDVYEASADLTTFQVNEEDSAMDLMVQGNGSKAQLVALVTDADDPAFGVASVPVAFYAGGESLGTVITDGNGRAVLDIPARYRGKKNTFEAIFDGSTDTYWIGSTDTTG